MPRPDENQIISDAKKLKADRYKRRDDELEARRRERFNETVIDVPAAYDKTANRHRSSIIEDEGRQIATLVHAMPAVHITTPAPEKELDAEGNEKFLTAWHKELEANFGPAWWQNSLAQVHDKVAFLYSAPRKVPYKNQPEPPADNADAMTLATYAVENERYKQEAGVASWWDYRYVPTATAYWTGNVYDPNRFYEIKDVPERDLMDAYGVTKNTDGTYSKKTEDPTTTPSGVGRSLPGSEETVMVVEYWDREWCCIVAETQNSKWMGTRKVQGGFLLAEWNHGWGRTPYFARPSFITDQTAEERKFSSPLDPIYTEMPEHKLYRTMGSAVAYQTTFAPLQVLSKETGDLILDDAGQPKTFLMLKPGEAIQLAPGQEIRTVPQSPEVANFWQEARASEMRLARYSLSPVSQGQSPGADTANAALSNLHRFQLSTLDPLAQQSSRQASALYRFALERIRDMKERVFVFDSETDGYLSLSGDEIVSVNVDAKVVPDQGQFQLLIEKHAAELKQLGLITLEQMYEMMGKENPAQLVLDLKAERLADQLDPIIMNQIITDLGMLDAVKQMIAANQQGQSADQVVPQLMQRLRGMNPAGQEPQTGMGQGAPGQPRGMGVRSPVAQTTTQPQLTGGA